MEQYLWLILLGLFVGMFGTLIGAGGGFILVPVMLLVYPDKSPELITSISLAVVFFNAISGSYAYAKMKRIDYKSGWVFAVATIPGALFGAFTTSFIPRDMFNLSFGGLLIILSLYLFFRPNKKVEIDMEHVPANHTVRTLVDAEGNEIKFHFNLRTGTIISFAVGYLSSLLGIGGGIIHVPILTQLLGFPVHVATATSHFVLTISALAGSLVHLFNGTLAQGVQQIVGLAIGVIVGAQIGAKFSKQVKDSLIIRSLALALGLVGIRIILTTLG